MVLFCPFPWYFQTFYLSLQYRFKCRQDKLPELHYKIDNPSGGGVPSEHPFFFFLYEDRHRDYHAN